MSDNTDSRPALRDTSRGTESLGSERKRSWETPDMTVLRASDTIEGGGGAFDEDAFTFAS
ncbi:MAG: hypothetical protein KDB21_04875 [Acidimicrobiales bacterium]|nr:hypothetical protein [Acidimicrobiales bacterium]